MVGVAAWRRRLHQGFADFPMGVVAEAPFPISAVFPLLPAKTLVSLAVGNALVPGCSIVVPRSTLA